MKFGHVAVGTNRHGELFFTTTALKQIMSLYNLAIGVQANLPTTRTADEFAAIFACYTAEAISHGIGFSAFEEERKAVFLHAAEEIHLEETVSACYLFSEVRFCRKDCLFRVFAPRTLV